MGRTVRITGESIRLGQLLKLSGAAADGTEAKSMIASGDVFSLRAQVMSSTKWFPTMNISLAEPLDLSSVEVMTSAAASITAPNELIHASLSWLDRK